jgi:membrane associated rhomboid family serine protease
MPVAEVPGEFPREVRRLVEVYRSSRRKRADEHSLVLQSMSVPHYAAQQGVDHVLLVDEQHERAAREQLALYAAEHRLWKRVAAIPGNWWSGLWAALAYGFAIAIVNALDFASVLGVDWRERGIAAAGLVRAADGAGAQPWRALTALTLHADGAHLVSNLVFGGFFVALLAAETSAGAALFAALATGTLGNLWNAWLQDPAHRSLGASTAVFGVMGVLVALELVRLARAREHWLRRLAVFGLGLYLFSMLGFGGEHTDHLAHACGFGVGIPVGLVLGWLAPHLRARRAPSVALAVVSGLVVTAAWAAAMSVR